MENFGSIRLRQLQGRLGSIVYELTRIQYSPYTVEKGWNPAVNAYRCRDQFVICVELAGVDKSLIDLQVEPRRVILRGRRPDPPLQEPQLGPLVQILALEIDSGPFERELLLPADVDPDQVRAEQRNGLLWIYLPLRSPA